MGAVKFRKGQEVVCDAGLVKLGRRFGNTYEIYTLCGAFLGFRHVSSLQLKG